MPSFFMASKGSECMPSETLHRRDAVSEPPWMGLRRVSEGTTITN